MKYCADSIKFFYKPKVFRVQKSSVLITLKPADNKTHYAKTS